MWTPGVGSAGEIVTLRKGLVFAGLVRGGPPGQSPPDRCKGEGENVTNNTGIDRLERGSRRGWNREGAASPAGKSVAKTGPGAEERFPCRPEARMPYQTPPPPQSHSHAFPPGLRPWGCSPFVAIQGWGALPAAIFPFPYPFAALETESSVGKSIAVHATILYKL